MTIAFELTDFDYLIAEAAGALAAAPADRKLSVFQDYALRIYAVAEAEGVAAGLASEMLEELASRHEVVARAGGQDALQHILSEASRGRKALHVPAPMRVIDAAAQWDTPQVSVEPTHTITAIELERFLQMETPPRAMLLAPWLPEQAIAMVHAYRGIGKTELILGTGYAVATGTGFLRWKAGKPRRVLLIDGEMPTALLQDRLNRVVRAAGGTLPELGFFRIVASDLHRDSLPDLSNTSGQQFYADVIADADLIIADNVSTLCPGYKENDADTWGPIQAWSLARRREGKSSLFVHHDGKNGAQRGTSRKEDVLDTVIGLRRPPGYSPDQGARFEVHFEKNRGFYGPDAEPFEARRIGDQWEISTIKAGDDDETLHALKRQGLTVREIAERTGISKTTVSRRLGALGDD